MNKYAAAVTIGCRLNQADTALIFDVLKNTGFEIVPQKTEKKLSLAVINTCSVTVSASQKSRQAARSIKKKHPEAFIIVTGCGVETEETWQNEECIDLIIPNSEKTEINKYLCQNETFKEKFLDNVDKSNTVKCISDNYTIKEKLPRTPGNNGIRTRYTAKVQDKNQDKNQDKDYDKDYDKGQDYSYDKDAVEEIKYDSSFSYADITGFYPFKCRANLKIQEGCDSYCTYCIVPYGRGKPRSRDLNDTVREFKVLLERGHREIVLTGVNIAMYNDRGFNLVRLLEELTKIPGRYRIRLSSTEPQFDNSNLVGLMKTTDKICRFLHLPIQHGTNEILRLMGRSYTTEEFADFIENAVSEIPDICIGTDIITGFPGETEELFYRSKNFIENLPLAYLHVFKYSKRRGTPAAEYKNQIPDRISAGRHNELSNVSRNLDKRYLGRQIGLYLPVLFERKAKDGFYTGWSDNYVSVKVNSSKIPEKEVLNKIVDTKIRKISGKRELIGTIEKESIKK
ncbi:MAG: tRNA (N(6)-L-threonylcarbamoyladenosine(37)-C(2))-methylthiotransferase MtaB [Victivallales bacterium]|nr:tRNA (N(6)-L-threonylcarbamoyladenosine(37)-C(2))-methylthiotransferase MtaB [Victivallales bacterium]MCF7889050.1 tRNA (N(6)-L-threonylcarbamoyladenosine(37)-C(2))-methylthiotransferase MtaB [Victivallales bacterium]